MKKDECMTVKIKFVVSLWDCIKLRIAGKEFKEILKEKYTSKEEIMIE